jgi:hypothetical protein
MKGKLVKWDNNRWMVMCIEEGDWETFYPLSIDDVNEINAWEQIFDNIEARIAANQDVNFELEDYWETGLEGPVKVARLMLMKEQTNGERFDEFMDIVKGYPELEGTMNLCNDIISSREISDEEITKLANEHILYNDSKRQWVIEGMKLYREQLRIRNEKK